MRYDLPEHPDIRYIEQHGYPPGAKVPHITCEVCDKCLDNEAIYEDSYYKYLCKECLLELHFREYGSE